MGNITLEQLSQKVTEEHNRVRRFIGTRIGSLMRKELAIAYKECIKQFYEYETQKYIRYGYTEPGTREGKNLYKGIDYNNYKTESFSKGIMFSDDDTVTAGITISSQEMIAHYEDTVSQVLDCIMHGIRYPIKRGSQDWMYFEVNYKNIVGTPLEVLTKYKEKISSKIADQAVQDAIRELGPQLKYIKIS